MARRFVSLLDAAPGGSWRDIGCGTGAVTQAVLDLAEPEAVVGIDPSPGYVQYARRTVTDPRAHFALADAVNLPFADATASVAVSGLVLNFVPDPPRAAAEMVRAVWPGGLVAAYVWDFEEGGMETIRAFWDAASALDPDARTLDEAVRFPLCGRAPMRELLVGAGLEDVEVDAIGVPTRFSGFDDFWQPFLGGQGPAPTYVASLPQERRAELRERLRSTLPRAADGSIELRARAWAARGRRTA
ncbi:class I SAM-dependent methyltransferase [Streptomyces sp. NPDC092307]|uniref:class I SAM-dependent methyltransferase n=1 Tax=Streptomyces sp. NPDC092307 TaxID=3366013 RepID=UPI00380B0940